uniref:(northern house mosquito) hypothetical protein n=1 Tax=Culex pipiens TaxID=7175 RepID=A0A8D8BD11_CULPI
MNFLLFICFVFPTLHLPKTTHYFTKKNNPLVLHTHLLNFPKGCELRVASNKKTTKPFEKVFRSEKIIKLCFLHPALSRNQPKKKNNSRFSQQLFCLFTHPPPTYHDGAIIVCVENR